MSEETTIIDKLNTNERPINAKPTRGRLILKNLTPKTKQLIKKSGLAVGGLLSASMLYSMCRSRYNNASDVIYNEHPCDTPSQKDTSLAPPDEEIAIIYTEACFANSVSDDMSFKDAFANARAETGPGGFFEWKGNVYNTYYEEEWNKMSDEQKNEYWSSVTAAAEYDTLTLIDEGDIEKEDTVEDKPSPKAEDSDTSEENDIDTHDKNDVPSYDNILTQNELEVIRPVFGIDHTNTDNIPDALAMDDDNDGYADAVLLDEDGDGQFEVRYADIDGDEDLDIIVVDHDGDGFADEIISEDTNATIPMNEFIIVPEDDPDVADNIDRIIEEDLPDELDDDIEEDLI